MPLQSSGIIVVDKTPVISSQQTLNQQAPQQQQQPQTNKTSTLPSNNSRQQQQQILGNNVIGNNNLTTTSNTSLTQFNKKNQQQQQKIIYGVTGTSGGINNSSYIGGTTDTNINLPGSATATPATIAPKVPVRKHQRIVSSSLSSAQQQQQQQLQQTTQIKQQFTTINQSNYTQMNQQQPQQQQHHLIQSGGGQVIVSEEFIEHAQATGGAHVVNISTNELLNPQIIKLVSSDGNGQNVLIDSLGNLSTTTTTGTTTTTNGGINHHANSKLVVGNLTVVPSKHQQQSIVNVPAGHAQQQFNNQQQQQQQHPTTPQQINFLNAKPIPYVSSKNQTVKKIVNIPLKSNNGLKNQQPQQHTICNPNNNNIVQTTTNNNNTGQMIQKVTMPRNVQVVARVQNVGQNQQPHSQVQQIYSQNPNQLLVQQNIMHNISGGNMPTKLTSNSNIPKRQSNQNKVQQPHKVTGGGGNTQQQQVKTFIHQQQPHQQYSTTTTNHQNIQQQHMNPTTKQIKPQKIIKHTNTINNPTTTVTLMQQQQSSQHLGQSGTYTICNKNNNLQSSQQKITGIGGGNLPSKNTVNSNTKYVMQNHIVIPTNSNTSSTVNAVPQAATTSINNHNHKNNNQNLSNCNVVNQPIVNTVCVGSNSGTIVSGQSSGTIKFVNAHGTVLQQTQQHQQPPISLSLTTQNTATKMRAMQQQQQHQFYMHQHQQNLINQQANLTHMIDTNSNGKTIGNLSNDNNILHIQATTFTPRGLPPHPQVISSSNPASFNDDIVIVNGTQMTDEVSARILQSMKSFGNQRQYQNQLQQKVVHSSAISSNNSTNQQPPVIPAVVQREYPIFMPPQGIQTQQQYPTYQPIRHTMTTSSANSRSSSIDKKNDSKKQFALIQTANQSTYSSSEFFRVNTNEIHKNYYSSPSICSTTNVIDNIPLPITRCDNTLPYIQQLELDDDIIGEEIRPIPVSTHDIRLQALHAFLQDHTYVAPMPVRLPKQLNLSITENRNVSVQLIPTLPDTGPRTANLKTQQIPIIASPISTVATTATAEVRSSNCGNQIPKTQSGSSTLNSKTSSLHNQLASSSGLGLCVNNNNNVIGSKTGGDSIAAVDSVVGKSPNKSAITNANVNNNANSANVTRARRKSKISESDSQYAHDRLGTAHHMDDDANSVISNGSSRNNSQGRLEMDLGEETETAPEAENEDDSVTRCICDFTHDDGYMICCDKCSVWQHVDCMGIDRENIPDEYLCEVCQPRTFDKNRARSLQLAKRKEQAILINAHLNSGVIGTNSSNVNGGIVLHTDISGQLVSSTQLADGKVTLAVVPQIGAKKGKAKKNDLLTKKTNANTTKKERNTMKRKETKRITKRKSKGSGVNSDLKNADKNADNLKQWIENYEIAVTNHYSPELRARLHAITKQQNLLQNIMAHENKWLKNCQDMDSKGTTVPHAGGKILISNFDILPNSAIMELRGKYMLATQFKTQNSNINMNSPPPVIPNLKNSKIPGPFVFFYHLPVDSNLASGIGGVSSEICVDTRTYGNEARFVRRSCRPNAELQYSFEKGTIHLYIVSLLNIMASTEITIKHEPHDLKALGNKFFTSIGTTPTSSVCACGLTRECAFGVPPALLPPQTQQQTDSVGDNKVVQSLPAITTKPIKNARKSILNGIVPEKKAKKNPNVGRGRSTSSSGESNCLVSPNINNNFAHNMNSTASISSILHDSGIYTSSSSPSVSIPSPINVQPTISSPPQHPQQQLPQQIKERETFTNLIQTATIQQPIISFGVLAPPSPIIPPIVVNTETNQVLSVETPVKVESVLDTGTIISSTTIVTASSPLAEMTPLIIKTEHKKEEDESLSCPTNIDLAPPIIEVKENSVKSEKILEPPEKLEKIEKLENFEESEESIPVPSIKTITPQKQQPPSQILPPQTPVVLPLKRRTSSKSRTTSSSEETPISKPKTKIKPEVTTKNDSTKLTREERKMEAIVRAFEKMEKNQQRKNELKNSKQSSAARYASTNKRYSTSPSQKRAKTLLTTESSSATDVNTSTPKVVSPLKSSPFKKTTKLRKKKQKRNKKTKQSVNSAAPRKRQNSRHTVSNDSDTVMTSDDSMSFPQSSKMESEIIIDSKLLCSDVVYSPLKTKIDNETAKFNETTISENFRDVPPPTTTTTSIIDTNVNQAAGLLLAFANPTDNVTVNEIDTREQQQQRHLYDSMSLQSPQPLVSPACLMIEKALGLETFKLPSKTTKTKKSLMSDWLNQSNEDDDISPPESKTNSDISQNEVCQERSSEVNYRNSPKGLETLVEAAMVDFRQNNSSPSFMLPQSNNSEPPPQHLNFVAKKVEEFISQSQFEESPSANKSSEFGGMDVLSLVGSKFDSSNSIDLSNSLQPMQLSSCSNSAAKKRWLRQAISEETDENVQSSLALSAGGSNTSTPPSASNSPTSQMTCINGFTTPLKKRRVVVVRNDNIEQNVSSPDEISSNRSCSDSNLSTESIKIEDIKAQIDGDDEVDVLRSPSPNGKKLTEDEDLNLVKMESEDIDIETRVDVEKEESSNEEKFERANNQVVTNDESSVINDESSVVGDKSSVIKDQSSVTSEELITQQETVDVIKQEITNVETVKNTTTTTRSKVLPKNVKGKIKSQQLKSIPNNRAKENDKIKRNKIVKSSNNCDKSGDSMTLKTSSDVNAASEDTGDENFGTVTDEIADIQKKLHSFHTANIMILQSRNKKSTRSSIETVSPSKNEKKEEITKLDENNKVGRKNVKDKNCAKVNLNFDVANKTANEIKLKTTRQTIRKHKIDEQPPATVNNKNRRQSSSILRSNEQKLSNEELRASTIVGEKLKRSNSVGENSESSYGLKTPVPVHNFIPIVNRYDMSQQTNLSTNLPQSLIVPSNISNELKTSLQINIQQPPPPIPMHLPYYNTIYGKLMDNKNPIIQNIEANLSQINMNVPPPSQSALTTMPPLTLASSMLSDYLVDNKPKSFNTLGGGYSSMFNMNNKLTNDNNMIGGGGVQISPIAVSTLTLGGGATTAAGVLNIPGQLDTNSIIVSSSFPQKHDPQITPVAGVASLKILTKTASHDPRLNPILTAPEPAPKPKRKLSINEYRKRKQQSTESAINRQDGGTSESTGNSSANSSMDKTPDKDTTDTSKKIHILSDSPKVVFSPAPTLLEQQQEILCERLRTFKQQKFERLECRTTSPSFFDGHGITLPSTSGNFSTTSSSFNQTEISTLSPNNHNNNSYNLINQNCDFDAAGTMKSSMTVKNNDGSTISSSSSSSSCSSSGSPSSTNVSLNSELMSLPNQDRLLQNDGVAFSVHDIDSSKINFNELRKIGQTINETLSSSTSSSSSSLASLSEPTTTLLSSSLVMSASPSYSGFSSVILSQNDKTNVEKQPPINMKSLEKPN